MEVRTGPDSGYELALEPGEIALYIRYSILPSHEEGNRHEWVDLAGFFIPLRYRIDPKSGMGCIEPIDAHDPALPIRWPLFVIAWTECLSAQRRRAGISYTVSPIPVRGTIS